MAHIWKSRANDDILIDRDSSKLFFKLNRWGGECFINVEIPVSGADKIKRKSNKKLKWVGPDFDVEFDKKDKSEPEEGQIRNELGGLELSIVLKKKPAQNYFEFPINSQNLDFFYQPPPTQKMIDEGHHVADDVVGSYAVYHKTKGQIFTDPIEAEKYKAGKVFHIYRPKVIDNSGNWIWGELSIVDGKLRVTVDSDFIQNAIYPITIDPNFGYETQGTWDYDDIEDYIWGARFLNASGTGSGDSISACLYINNQKVKCALYDGADPANYIQTTDERTDIPEKAKDFYTFNFSSSPDINNNTTYGLVAWGGQTGGGGYARLYYDQDVGIVNISQELAYGSWPATLQLLTFFRKFSIYCIFTSGAGDIIKVINEALQFNEGTLRPRIMKRIRNETLQLNEGIVKFRKMLRTVGETLQVGEGVLKFKGLVRIIGETLGIQEGTLKFKGVIKIINETLQISEGIIRLRKMVRLVGENVSISEDSLASRVMKRIINETVQITESIVKKLTAAGAEIIKVINETLELVEMAPAIKDIVKVIAEALEINETSMRPRVMIRQLDETLQVTENIAKLKRMVREINETLQLNEGIGKILGFIRIVSEALQLNEGLVKIKGIIRMIDESVNLQEGVVRTRKLVRLIAENVSISEGSIARRVMTRVVDETVRLAENIVKGIVFPIIKIINEVLNIQEGTLKSLYRFVVSSSKKATDFFAKKTSSFYSKTPRSGIKKITRKGQRKWPMNLSL